MNAADRPPSMLQQIAEAAAAERDATPFVARHIIGPVAVDLDASTAQRWQVVVATGSRRVGDGPLERPLLVDLVGRRSIRPDAVLSWEGGELRLEGTSELPADLLGSTPGAAATATTTGSAPGRPTALDTPGTVPTSHASLPTGRTWYLVTEGGPPLLPTARAEALARLAGAAGPAQPGPALAALLADPLSSGADQALRVVADHGASLAAAAVVAGRLRAASPGGTRVLVVAEVRRADAVAAALDDLLGRPDAGRVLRVGVTASSALTTHPRLGLRAAMAVLPPADAAGAGLAESAARRREHDLAAAILAEARAIRAAAEAGAASAAAEHRAAAEALERVRASREGFRRLEELVVRIERMEAELAVWCADHAVRLAAVSNGPRPQPDGPATGSQYQAAEATVGRLTERAVLLEQLDAQQRDVRRLGVSRRTVHQCEQAAHRTRLAHLDADAALHRARAAEQGAAAELAARRAAQDMSGTSEAEAERATRLATAAIGRAAVVVSTPEDVATNPVLTAADFDEVVVDRAGSLPLVTLCLLAMRCRGPMTLTVQDPAAPGSSRPPQPACADPRYRRWLNGPDLGAVTGRPH